MKKKVLTVLTLWGHHTSLGWSIFRLLLEKKKLCLVSAIVTWVCATTRTISPRKKIMEVSRKEKKFPFRDLASPTEDLYKRPHLHINTSAGLVLQFPGFLQTSPPQSVHSGQGTAGCRQQPSKGEMSRTT